MKSYVRTDLQKLAFDAVNSKDKIGMSKEQMNDAIRNAINTACGSETWNPYAFKKNAQDVFQLLAEIMPVNMRETLDVQLNRFCDFRDENLGEKTYFKVEDRSVYNVLTVSTGNQNITRNKIIDSNFKIDTVLKGVKFFDELESFMRGNMDFARLSEKANEAMSTYVGELISTTIYGGYSAIQSRFKATGSYDPSTLNLIIENIKAENKTNAVQIFGTTTALANVADGFGYSDAAKDRANTWGYYGQFRGADLIALPQAYSSGTDSFHVDNSHLIILPAGEKIVKVVFEGAPIVDWNDNMNRNDMQYEIIFLRRVGAAALTAIDGKYGMYKFS
jgi:hypothetical protein